jgi:hypothetical protein
VIKHLGLNERQTMLCRFAYAFVAGLGLVASGARTASDPPTKAPDQVKSATERAGSRPEILGNDEFPRIAMLCSPAAELKASRTERLAKYGVSVVGAGELGLRWKCTQHADLAEDFEPATIETARAALANVLAANRNAIVCCEIYFFEAQRRSYPEDHAWWFRDAKGQKVSFWRGAYNMDVGNEAYIEHIATRIIAVHDALEGKAGIFLDNLRFDQMAKRGWLSLLKKLRAARPNILLLVNSGWSSTDLDWIAPLINGILYEDAIAHTRDKDTEALCQRLEAHWNLLRTPRISVNERFGARSDKASMLREPARTLVYTDAYFIYTDSTYGHRHSWRPEWDAPLGKAVDAARSPSPGQLAHRAFKGGTVSWLPESAKAPVAIEFHTPHASASGGSPTRSFMLEPGTGLILVRMH